VVVLGPEMVESSVEELDGLTLLEEIVEIALIGAVNVGFAILVRLTLSKHACPAIAPIRISTHPSGAVVKRAVNTPAQS
jgi:hypothetical protein